MNICPECNRFLGGGGHARNCPRRNDRLHDPAVLRGIIARNAMQRLTAGDDNAPMYVTAQDIKDGVEIAKQEREKNHDAV